MTKHYKFVTLLSITLFINGCKKTEAVENNQSSTTATPTAIKHNYSNVQDASVETNAIYQAESQPTEVYEAEQKSEPISEEDMIISKYGDKTATVIYENSGCDYIILETSNSWYVVAEKYAGSYSLTTGDIVRGNLASFDFKNVYQERRDTEMRLYVDNYYASKQSAMEKYAEKCD